MVSVVICTWNNWQSFLRCLSFLAKQTYVNFEILVIDNNSDKFPLDIEKEIGFIKIELKQLGENHGFAAANNIGVRLARGKYIALLNADAFPEPDWIEKLVQAAESSPQYSCFASRQIQANTPDLLDGAGDSYHISGLGWRRHYNKPVINYGLQQEEVFSPCGAAALYLRDDFLQAGGFDEDYFSYFEDVDLGFRLRLSGKKCLYVPEAVVHHVGSASTGKKSDFSVYYGYRNLIWTFIKNMPTPLFWIFLPLHIVTLLFFTFYLTVRGQGKVIFKAIRDAIRGLPVVLRKRKIIQENIKIQTGELLKIMSTGLFDPYLEFIKRNRSA